MLVQEADVVICGSGSAGLCAATWLARCGVSCRVLEKRAGPMTMGQADGVQCRTVEVFDSFGLADQLLKEAYHVMELAFWSPDGQGGIHRTRRAPDTEPGLSHQPHLILNQARINGMMLEAMKDWNGQEVDYGYEVLEVRVDSQAASDPLAKCVTVVTRKDGKEVYFKTRYALGCDGAHSAVRRSLGFKMIGDSTDSVWGVMDIYPRSDFPDLRRKCTIRSDSGVIVLIPREGGSLVRLYIELGQVSTKEVKLEDLHMSAQRIFSPYTLEVSETAWWSAYPIGQRHADHFTQDHRVFLTGDACHTHSPKAGQGMNVSLQDGYNIGWKLAAVLKGRCPPSILETYVLERRKVAVDLIEFDRSWSKLFSSSGAVTPGGFSDQFLMAGRYTAGLTAKYDRSPITSDGRLSKLDVGMRLPSTQVVRFCDAKEMQLVKAFPADGRWRILIFASVSRLQKLADVLEPLARRYTNGDIDSFIDPVVILPGGRFSTEQAQIPDYFWPPTGKWKMRDLHKVFSDEAGYHSAHGHAYQFYGIDPEPGAMVVVRPDQYVAKVAGLQEYQGIIEFFEGFALLA